MNDFFDVLIFFKGLFDDSFDRESQEQDADDANSGYETEFADVPCDLLELLLEGSGGVLIRFKLFLDLPLAAVPADHDRHIPPFSAEQLSVRPIKTKQKLSYIFFRARDCLAKFRRERERERELDKDRERLREIERDRERWREVERGRER